MEVGMGYDLGNAFNMSGGLSGVWAFIIAVSMITSVLQCFFGYKIFKFWIGVQGFILFGLIGAGLGYLAFKGQMGLVILFGIILGGLGAFLAMKLYKIGVFIQCFGTGLIFGILLGIAATLDAGQMAAMAIVFGTLLGIIGVILIKPLIILSTGFSGGMTLGCGLALLIKQNIILGILLGIIISICGVLYQFYTDKKAVKTPTDVNANA
jgi:hypothetical protein